MPPLRLPPFLLLLSASLSICWGQSYSVEDHHSDDSLDLVEKLPGRDNIIISVPHGGYLSPSRLEAREDGCWEDGRCVYRRGCRPKSSRCKIIPRRDKNALEAGRGLVARLQARGRRPYAVFMLAHRVFIDANRSPEEACEGHELCLKVYEDFHSFIREARRRVSGPGIYLDVHSIRHRANWTELGYRISKQELNSTGPLREVPSSIAELRRRSGVSLEELVRGNLSLGHRLSVRGYKVIPSPTHPRPGTQGYARGGFNTLQYGSLLGGCVDGVQVEASRSIRLGGQTQARRFGEAVADALLEFMADFGYDDPTATCGAARAAGTAVAATAAAVVLWLRGPL